ncbi:MAG: glycosyltransferase family protein [Gammaproteobacteria bacterium]|nr:glycosyltransferase family protein [Gammaproteobacteria bacterium]
MMQVLTLLQARTTSTRLPGKVLKPVLGEPMMQRQIERTRAARNIGKLAVATSDHPSDNAIEALCSSLHLDCFRGSLDDVLDRYHQAALHYKPQHIVRMTCDCPLMDPRIVDDTIERHLREGNDYTSAGHDSGYPRGLNVEVMRRAALETAWREARSPDDREHVTLYIKHRPEQFRAGRLVSPADRSGMRWTVDTPEDFSFITRVYEMLYPGNPRFDMEDILQLLSQHPELSDITGDTPLKKHRRQ